jgi:hypothetical protein
MSLRVDHACQLKPGPEPAQRTDFTYPRRPCHPAVQALKTQSAPSAGPTACSDWRHRIGFGGIMQRHVSSGMGDAMMSAHQPALTSARAVARRRDRPWRGGGTRS